MLFPLFAALAARPFAQRLEPRLATWLLTVSAVALAAASTAALALLALTGLVRIPQVAALGQFSLRIVQEDRGNRPLPSPAHPPPDCEAIGPAHFSM
ncbi:hypothetical protein [Streptomyces sp. H27-D2]|uniref:hypothetical protein n=1 Tax=Streptomyces sp. H27-D2 TaxID=3046304 RepID=UPI002DBC55EB|nr:hypothetical protein [Streptomyces sp. H27-D2]MEC4019846.1 hypothetical protein [Streptomyces sp. H27-D2]